MKPESDAGARPPRPGGSRGPWWDAGRRDTGRVLPIAVLIAGWAFSGWVFFLLQRDNRQRQEQFFSERVAEAQAAIRVRMTSYEDALRGGTSYFTASKSVDRYEWRVYAASLQLDVRYPGINGLGVIFVVPPDRVAEWQARVRGAGELDRVIAPFPDTAPRPGETHYLITFLEGNVTDSLPVGRDIATESSRRRAAELARDTGEPQLHFRRKGSRDLQRRSGLLLYVPLYANEAKLGTVAERRAAHLGWIYAQVYPELFLDGVLGPIGETLRLSFFEGAELSRERLLHTSMGPGVDPLGPFERVTQMRLAGQTFQLGWVRGPRFPASGNFPAAWAGGSLAVATLLLAGLITSLQSLGRRAGAIAAERTEQLAASEARMRLFAEHAPASVAMLDREMRYLVVSREWMRTHQVAGDIIGRSHDEVAGPMASKWRAIHQRCLSGAVERSEADLFVRPDGSKQWQRWEVRPWFDAAGKIGGIVVLTADITERKRLEENLAVARDEALAASRLKSEFLATMSHEIRTPMNAIIGLTGLLADARLPAEQGEMLSVLQSSAESLLTIINDILDFSKIEAGKLRLDPADFDLRRVVDETVALFGPKAQGHGIAFHTSLALGPRLLLRGDAGRVRQILSNLIGNAIKFTTRGEVTVEAAVVRETPGRVKVRLAVRDTGVGIAPEVQAKLFQPFVQADPAGRGPASGTGLGLAISRQLVEAMGGEIGLQSQPGEGSTFWFVLELPRATRESGRELGTFSHLRVLVVEGAEGERSELTRLLAKLGVPCEAVADGPAALAALRARAAEGAPFHVAILDWQLPGMSGLDTAMEIRAIEALAPTALIVMSGGALADPGVATAAGVEAFLQKPVRVDQIERCLIRVVRNLEAASGSGRPGAATVTAGRPLQLLLAEDNLASQVVGRMLLTKMGFQVDIVGDGEAALARLAAQRYDAVLMDCQMPLLNGYEATRRIRAGAVVGVDPAVPVIAVTAYAMREDRERCLQAGMTDYISKPVRPAELRAALQRCGVLAGEPEPAAEKSARPGGGPAPAPTDGVLDARALEVVRGLAGASGPSLLPELVEAYLVGEAAALEGLAECAQQLDLAGLAERAHGFAGNVAAFGAFALRDVALEVEKVARAGDAPAARFRLGLLRVEAARLRVALRLSKLTSR